MPPAYTTAKIAAPISQLITRRMPLPNAPRLSCAARAGGRADMMCGARQYVGAQMEFCQGRAAQLQPLGRQQPSRGPAVRPTHLAPPPSRHGGLGIDRGTRLRIDNGEP